MVFGFTKLFHRDVVRWKSFGFTEKYFNEEESEEYPVSSSNFICPQVYCVTTVLSILLASPCLPAGCCERIDKNLS